MRTLSEIIDSISCNGMREMTTERIGQVIQEYDSERENNRWISIDEGFPGIGENVLVVTEFLHKGNPASEMFVAYLDEGGDLNEIPNDDNYGCSFKECVTFWMRLPDSPIK